jgi:cation diffusion facilitator CzcD-associated flavoprotein CzcO
MLHSCDAIVIGAGPAGLATAAAMQRRGLDAVILEKTEAVGAAWRRHWDGLHLHTIRAHSGLPGMPMPKIYGRFPSRADVVEYLETYAAKFALKPIFGAKIEAIRRDDWGWRAEAKGAAWRAPLVVVATGWADYPYSPGWPGMESFSGPILHSREYRNPTPFAGKRVLVVGFGNSGGEIALELAKARVDTTVSVRGPLWVAPREVLGVSVVTLAIAQRHVPARLADPINALVFRLTLGPVERLGLREPVKGPRRMTEEDGRTPLLDSGTIAAMRAGLINSRGDIVRFTPDGAVFAAWPPGQFDAVILATGFRPDLRPLLPDAHGVLNANGAPLVSGASTAEAGLFFCGAITVATGQLRQIGIEARRIAEIATAARAA